MLLDKSIIHLGVQKGSKNRAKVAKMFGKDGAPPPLWDCVSNEEWVVLFIYTSTVFIYCSFPKR